MAFELIGEGTQTFTGVALQAGAQYGANLPTINKGVKATYVAGNIAWASLAGMDSGTTLTVYSWGVWNYADSTQTAILRVSNGIFTGTANAATYAITVGANAAGSVPFQIQGSYNAAALWPGMTSPILTPWFGMGWSKGGTGTLTAGTFTFSYKLYGFTR